MALFTVAFEHTQIPEYYEGFWNIMDDLGPHEQINDGAYLLYAGFTALGVRRRLLPTLHELDRLVVVQMYKGHCAGQLPDRLKEFVRRYVQEDPASLHRISSSDPR